MCNAFVLLGLIQFIFRYSRISTCFFHKFSLSVSKTGTPVRHVSKCPELCKLDGFSKQYPNYERIINAWKTKKSITKHANTRSQNEYQAKVAH